MLTLTDDFLKDFLIKSENIVIVGASNKKERASNGIARFLLKKGYECFLVNPKENMILGKRTYKTLADIPVRPDIVDVFRKSEATPSIVEEAIKKEAKLIWLQEEVYSEKAKMLAEKADIPIVMNKCLYKEFMRLGLYAI